jgi:soluble lytic murein transglycosylase-like protein
MSSLFASQINAEYLRAFYKIFETYLQDKTRSQPILPLRQNHNSRNTNPVNGSKTENFQNMIETVASKYQVDAKLVKAVVQTESNFDANAVSSAGAEGLMQLMPATAQELGVQNTLDPMQNLDGGVRYLRKMLDAYDGNVSVALAAYNAGPGTVNEYGGVPPYEETQNYVSRVLGQYNQNSGRRS